MIKIWTIWIRNSDDEHWIEDAWDEYSIDSNPSGWEERVAKARAMAAEAGYELRLIALKVSWQVIDSAFVPVEAQAVVSESSA